MESITLKKEPFLFINDHLRQISTEVGIYEVKLHDRFIFIDRLGSDHLAVWKIRGRAEEYPTADAALAVLQGEVDAGTLS